MRVRVANSAANWWKSVELKERQERGEKKDNVLLQTPAYANAVGEKLW